MPPWRLDGLVEERVAKCRRLLEQPSPHQGSADMRCYVEYADLVLALHRTALDGRGQPRTALPLGDKLQLCTLFVLALSKHPLVSLGIEPAADAALMQAVSTLPQDAAWQPLSIALFVCGRGPMALCEARRGATAALARLLRGDPAAAAALPARLAAAGSAHAVTASVLQQAAQYRVVKAALEVCERCASGGGLPPPAVVRGALEAADALLQLAPDWPRYLLLRAEVAVVAGDVAAVPAILRRAIQAATAQKAHYWAGQASASLATTLMCGGEGRPDFSPPEVAALLDDAEREYKLSRAWASAAYSASMAEVKEQRRELRLHVAAAPRGAPRVPMASEARWGGAAPNAKAACGTCGQHAAELKKCSRCRAVAYCCRECQMAHWRRGHKRECAPAAAK